MSTPFYSHPKMQQPQSETPEPGEEMPRAGATSESAATPEAMGVPADAPMPVGAPQMADAGGGGGAALATGKAVSDIKLDPPELSRLTRWMADKATPSTLFIALVILAIVLSFIVALADPTKGLGWLFGLNEASGQPVIDIAVALAPLLALALAIERIIETGFSMFERATDQVAELGQVGIEGYQNMLNEYARYGQSFNTITNKLKFTAAPDEIQTLETQRDLVLQKMERARGWIDNIPKDPGYVSFKRMTSIWVSLLLGIIVAVFSVNAGIFGYLNIRAPRILDILVTGFVIGAGSGPMHYLIGSLQSLKDMLSGLGQLGSLGVVKQQVRDLQEIANQEPSA